LKKGKKFTPGRTKEERRITELQLQRSRTNDHKAKIPGRRSQNN